VSRISALFCALACAFATLSVAPPAAHADGAGPVRILIVGDSLTLGRHGMYTWRYRLDKEFHRQGVPFDFVGSLTSTYVDKGFPAPRYADPNFDQDHFCKSGWWLRDAIADNSLGTEVAKQDPDLVVLELGGADVTYGDSPEVTIQRLRTAIGQMRAAKPTVHVILPKQLTKDRDVVDPSINTRTRAYDTQLVSLAAELTTTDSPITIADTMTGWDPAGVQTMDGSHLSPTGEAFYAQAIAGELHEEGILPQAPDVYHGYIPYTRTVPLALSATAGHLHASWSRQTVSSARVRWRPAGTTSWRTSALYPKGKVDWAVPAGHAYDVQLQITWYRLTGAWGSTSRVNVPRVHRPPTPARVTIKAARVRWTASAGATSYVVKFHRAHRPWVTRHTRSTSIRAAHVTVAEVRAVNAGGTSGWRLARRTA
jgi:hypothetical protein